MAWNIAFEKLPSPILLRGDEHIAYRDLEHWTFAGSADFGENVCVIPTQDGCRMFHSPQQRVACEVCRRMVQWFRR